MLPIPAIDIQKGKCVRLKMGDLTSAKIYYENPLEAAEFWIKKGTKIIKCYIRWTRQRRDY